MSDEETWERRWVKAVKTIAEREEVIDVLKAERDQLEANMRARPTGTRSQREAQLEKQVEALQTQFGAMRERTVAAEAEIERHLKDKSDWATKWEAEHNSYLDQRDRATALAAEVERLTRERDTYKASWEQLTVEKAQSSWGEFQRQGKMMQEALRDKASAEDRANKLEAQVKRLLAKEGKRIELEALNKRLDEPLPELGQPEPPQQS
jgi:chromosome segregation ATPase